jgi:hypothetical protein
MVIETNFERKARNQTLAMGSIGPTISRNATPDVWDHTIEQTIQGQYSSIADYLVDLAIDEAFKQKTSEPKPRG